MLLVVVVVIEPSIGFNIMKYKICFTKIRKESNELYLATNNDLELYFFNKTTVKILKYIKNNFDTNEIINAFQKEYNVDVYELEKDISSTINYLEENKFIKKEDDN